MPGKKIGILERGGCRLLIVVCCEVHNEDFGGSIVAIFMSKLCSP